MDDNRYTDLHVHTTASDGTYMPTAVVEHAVKLGFSAISITDHDALSGIDEAILAGEKTGLEVVPGVELSTEYKDKEVHILGYYIDWHNAELNRLTQEFRDFRVARMERMLSVLRNLGCRLNEKELMKQSEEGAIGRPHLARAMVDSGFVETMDEAFDKYLASGKPAYMKKAKLTPEEACVLIKNTGGVAVLAHPYLMKHDEWIPEFIKAGIDGLEAYYPGTPMKASKRYCKLAKKNSLIISGGSDCHQSGNKFLLGAIKLPYCHLQKIKEIHKNRKK